MFEPLFIEGDALRVLEAFEDASFDACVTDPPYELGFMGKQWDKSGIAYNPGLWRQVHRVLKPGGHLLSFGGSRTYHRMASAIEDAGFEIRDQIQWIYGSGFPKSLNISKAIDKINGDERPVIGELRCKRMGGGEYLKAGNPQVQHQITSAASAASAAWSGWGTALKPSHEPICLGRKPLDKNLNVAENVLKHGTGGLNIDACRIPAEKMVGYGGKANLNSYGGFSNPNPNPNRFPSNVIHDGSDEVLACFPETDGIGHAPTVRGIGGLGTNGHAGQINLNEQHFDTGSASRFFYCAKASNSDREAGLREAGRRTLGNFPGCPGKDGSPSARNVHPTVKPTELMEYLCRLITPAGGIILDPFVGSGSTAKAAVRARFRCVGIDMNRDYLEIAKNRLNGLQISLI